ncbi:hypothetical protein GOV07_01540 [Candidatus Woesearchaeota archaeon]|nr:hypothetical protein [Candidatus Woesearchaeota archaeon]
MGGTGFRVSFLVAFFLFGAYLIEPSMTGYVVGEPAQQVLPDILPIIGLALIALAISLVIGELVWRRKKEEQKAELRRNRKVRVV